MRVFLTKKNDEVLALSISKKFHGMKDGAVIILTEKEYAAWNRMKIVEFADRAEPETINDQLDSLADAQGFTKTFEDVDDKIKAAEERDSILAKSLSTLKG